ncbi:hypothetical protein GF325_03770 [Candidatus Bathyarchaeota archaeon]|nr:hypothetical protein [Candidatus Bathyarchaeota archaeon]
MESLSERQKLNVYLIKREFIRELDKGLGIIKKSISRVYSGVLTNIPSNIFYYIYFRGKVRRHVLNQIKISLRMAIDYHPERMEAMVEKYKSEYLENDLITMHCRQDHPIYSELREITINNLYTRIPILHELINSHGNTYHELVKNAFSSKEEIRRVLEIQLIFIDQWIEILNDNKDILISPKVLGFGLPIEPDTVFKVIMETYEYGMARLEEKMQHFFPPAVESDTRDTRGGNP